MNRHNYGHMYAQACVTFFSQQIEYFAIILSISMLYLLGAPENGGVISERYICNATKAPKKNGGKLLPSNESSSFKTKILFSTYKLKHF